MKKQNFFSRHYPPPVGKSLKYRVLQFSVFILLILSVLFLFNACNKDIVNQDRPTDLVSLNWSPTEKIFFNISNVSSWYKEKVGISYRSTPDSLPQLLVEAYNQLGVENETKNFAERLTAMIGIPFWTYSYVNIDESHGGGLIITPVGFENGSKTMALLVASKSSQYPDNKFDFKLVLRKDVEQTIKEQNFTERPNLLLEIGHFIYADINIYNTCENNFVNFISDNETALKNIYEDYKLLNRDCIIYKFEHCFGIEVPYDEGTIDENTGAGGPGEWGSGFGPDNNGGWTKPWWSGGGGVIFDWGDGNGSNGNNEGGNNEGGNNGGGNNGGNGGKHGGGGGSGSFGRWWKGFWDDVHDKWNDIFNIVECPFIKVKNNNSITKMNSQQTIGLRGNSASSDCWIYYVKKCTDDHGNWVDIVLNDEEKCDLALDNFIYKYHLTLSQAEIDYLQQNIPSYFCYESADYNKQAIYNLIDYYYDILVMLDPGDPEAFTWFNKSLNLIEKAGYGWFSATMREMLGCNVDCTSHANLTIGEIHDYRDMIIDFVSQINQKSRQQYISEWMMALYSPDIVGTILMFANFSLNLPTPKKFELIYSVAKRALTICNEAKGFATFNAFKSVYGEAGTGKAWHHIVEQNTIENCNFAAQRVHNPGNLVKIEGGFSGAWHNKITGAYAQVGRYQECGGKSLREWLKDKSFETHYEWGIRVMNELK